jgi:hypothetical protein
LNNISVTGVRILFFFPSACRDYGVKPELLETALPGARKERIKRIE